MISLLLIGCGPTRYINTETVYNVIDSTIYHIDTTYIDIPREVIKDIVPVYDTLKMETSVATSEAWVDTTTHSLKGTLKNKETKLEKEILWKEKIVYKDSLVTKEVPVEVEKPVTKYPKTY